MTLPALRTQVRYTALARLGVQQGTKGTVVRHTHSGPKSSPCPDHRLGRSECLCGDTSGLIPLEPNVAIVKLPKRTGGSVEFYLYADDESTVWERLP